MGAIQPTKNHKLIIDEFIRYAQQHLSTVSGIVNTVSTYPPLNTPGPGISNWSGYTVQPAKPSVDEFLPDEEEAKAIQTDILVEYPKTTQIYESEFNDEDEVGTPKSPTEVIQIQKELTNDDNTGGTRTGGTRTGGGGGDTALFNKCGNGHWPALGEGPAPNFEVSSTEGSRTWYKQNPVYIKQNCTQILFPTINGDKKITVHKDLASVVQPAIDEIKKQGLQKYIENCAGGLAVRNVTGGTRLSNHAWGTAIDMNTIRYPYGYKFGDDGIYVGKVKKRDFDEFDKGFLKVTAIFKSKGMTWLSNFDPMHVSIYE